MEIKNKITTIGLMLVMGMITTGCGGDKSPAKSERSDGAVSVRMSPPDRETRRAGRDEAIAILVSASRGDDPFLRANAIEAMSGHPDRALPMVQRGINDPAAVVRFTAIVTAARLDMRSLINEITPRKRDPNQSVQAAAIIASHMLDPKISRPTSNQSVLDAEMSRLAGMLESSDPGLRGNVAMLLGISGDTSAIPLLKQSSQHPMPGVGTERRMTTQVQIAEALAMLGDEAGYQTLRVNVHNSLGEVRVLAITAMGAVGDEVGAGPLQTFIAAERGPEAPREVRLAAAGALARIAAKERLRYSQMRDWLNEARAKSLLVTREYIDHPEPVVRSQAAWTLGWFNEDESFMTLREKLKDPSPQVRVAAAGSILRIAAN